MAQRIIKLDSVCLLLLVNIHASLMQEGRLQQYRMQQGTRYCRDRLGYFPGDIFSISACSLCYFYLIKDSPKFQLNPSIHAQYIHLKPFHLISNSTLTGKLLKIFPSIKNYTSFTDVCATLSDIKCRQWIACCEEANRCCEQQADGDVQDDESVFCPQTFDGWSCWNTTQPGTTAVQTCPSFLYTSGSETAQSRKLCSVAGAWSVDNDTGLEHTDYRNCVLLDDVEMYRVAVGLGIFLNVVGTILLSISVYIFCSSRLLLRQLMVKIHVNLFVSLLLVQVLSLVWETGVQLDLLTHEGVHPFLHDRQWLCKSLLVLHMYCRTAVFFWMTCEGFFLHRLMRNTFDPPTRIFGYIVFGWGIPSLLYIVYGSLRKVLADDGRCWITPLKDNIRALDWTLVFVPTALCILANSVFLGNILKLLTCQMVSHANEPGNFRKALKAVGMLVPLFGLQQFCLIYRPSPEHRLGYDVYEIFSTVILNSQGIIISLVFCFFNSEVRSHVQCPSTCFPTSPSDNRNSIERRKMSFSSYPSSRRTSVTSLQLSCSVTATKYSKNEPGHINSAMTATPHGSIQITSL